MQRGKKANKHLEDFDTWIKREKFFSAFDVDFVQTNVRKAVDMKRETAEAINGFIDEVNRAIKEQEEDTVGNEKKLHGALIDYLENKKTLYKRKLKLVMQ